MESKPSYRTTSPDIKSERKMTTIELKEYEEKKESELHGLDLVGFRKYLNRQKLNSVIDVYSDSIKSSQWVGVIKYKKTIIQILPKLICDKDDNKTILKNLIYMLSFTKRLDIKTNEVAKLSKEKNPFMEILIREFADSLFDCLKRLTPQKYIREENNLNYLKGKIKFSENIRYNCSNSAKFYCEYDEYSENNILNQLFLFVSTCLYSISNNNYNKKILKFITNYYADIDLICFDKVKAEKIKLSRNQEMFKKPFMLAKMFIENATVDLTKNRLENIILLWDMNKLFEEFVFELLKRNENKNGLEGWKFTAQKGKYLFKNDKDKYRMTNADIFAERGDEKVIIDTKYKKFDTFKDVSNSDIFQVTTYCLLHNATKGILLYPRWKEDNNKKEPFILNTGRNDSKINIDFKTIDLKQNDLKEELAKENNEIIKGLKKLF
jgi:5-methylcytosine-specific restriction enzyme subunit McrC